uniref:Cytochrome c biogenesis protein Ccs1 n=1 Tax=Bulboplastis apyrenoidosa TaxID=1070855 RepID=A0A1Y9TM36_9RHOD|nr:cytochrome c biogenesis protein ccs1 [Bulboplastis apyrenoidosa]ARO90711.1 cytochrome c biogenesis protein ccs1 [Bulboplastis apyrenoidosa]
MENYVKQFRWSIVKILSNLSVAITLLSIILLLSLLGTIIEQDKDISFYQNTYSQQIFIPELLIWKIIILLGLNHVYSNTSFFLLLIILAISLITCTFSNQIPIFKISKTWSLVKTSKNDINLNFNSKLHYYTFQHYEYSYSYKGLIGRLAPMIVHASIVLILSGSMVGYSQGFMAQEFIPKGEFFHIQNTVNIGPLSYIPQNFNGKINNFFIEYNQNKISQYFSNISLLNDSNMILIKQSIFVNKPLAHQNITIYQTDWSLLGLRVQSSTQKTLQLFLQKINNKDIWITTIRNPTNNQEEFSLLISDLTGNIFLYNKYNKSIKYINLNMLGQLINQFTINHPIAYYNRIFKVVNLMTSTGLQIKSDPGTFLVYTGFFLLIISSICSYLSYCQVWIYRHKQYTQYKGITNRAIIYFDKEYKQIIKAL